MPEKSIHQSWQKNQSINQSQQKNQSIKIGRKINQSKLAEKSIDQSWQKKSISTFDQSIHIITVSLLSYVFLSVFKTILFYRLFNQLIKLFNENGVFSYFEDIAPELYPVDRTIGISWLTLLLI